MTWTWSWNEIIALALRRSGVVGRGQVANANNTADALATLNLLLDELDGEGLSLPSFNHDLIFNTVSGQALYLLGEGELSSVTTIRPEQIITATITISTNPIVNITMAPITYINYTMIAVPSTQSQTWNYAINEFFPQMELWLYPVPNQVYPITLNCKVRWADTTRQTTIPSKIGQPTLNPFLTVPVPSGFITALVNVLSLRLAENDRLDTSTLEEKAYDGKYVMMRYIQSQLPPAYNTVPRGLFPWNVGIAGRNP